MNAAELQKVLPINGRKVLLSDRQDTKDIIAEILNKHDLTKAQYDLIAERFWKGNAVSTAKGLFDFLKKNVRYGIESLGEQSVKTPGAILYTGEGDCKHYASFINGVFDALKRKGYPVECIYRFASYTNSKRPKHVFAVLIDKGSEYFIDPVLSSFNKRFPMYKHKEDYRPGNRQSIGALYDISGVPDEGHWTDMYQDNDQIGLSINPRLKEKLKKATQFDKHAQKIAHGIKVNAANAGKFVNQNVKSAGKDIAAGAKKVVQVAKKVGAFVPRNAYLSLLALNGFQLAVQIWKKAAYDRNSANWKKIEDFWKKLGGNPNQLYQSVVNGKNLYNKRHPNNKVAGMTSDIYDMYDDGYGSMSGVYYFNENEGISAVPIAAILAAAAPIIAAMAALLNSMGISNRGSADGSDTGEGFVNTENATSNPYQIPGSNLFSTPSDAVYSENNVPDSYSNNIEKVDADEDRSKTNDYLKPVKDNFFEPVKNFVSEHQTGLKWGAVILGAVIVAPPIIDALKGKKRRR